MGAENAVASSFNRIGMVLRQMKRYDESLEYYNKSLEIRRKNNQVGSIPWTMLGIASTYEEMKRLPEALDFYNHGMIAGDKRCTLQCLSGSGRINSLLGNASLAEESLKKSLGMARELKAPSLVAEAYLGLANHYETTGNTIKALKNHKLYHKTRETVQSDEAQNRLRNVEISYAVEKSEQEKEIYRLKNVELKQAYDLIDEINKEITAGINYASRIQRAMLSNPSQIRGLTNKYFILYLPKEIVSGDFYWFNKAGNKLTIVAGDCTGHGVPGALMSMLGISFLEEIVNLRGIEESGKILDELRKEVIRALKQEGKREDVKDGMDISICVIDRDNKTLQYSGANNNLYLVRENELIEYSADRMPIGAAEIGEINYTSTDIDIIPDDIIYMFSDGYADQSGGPNRKKFKYSVLKTFLLSIHNLPMQKQKQMLEKGFYDWKGINPQRDDILIMGLKI
jgi:serine phosphatase RsbU (regulator of sigma subunit)